ncbi:MAG: 3-methyl-2-oxobutanoate hydroxymethyltransferase, partial [Candidatus Hydrogenedentes bacterium]|nr:3-methyl-2-oxobutanoate hydroxymethyltransferase [Candidatus Hydrogenedentota bacterium]
AGMDGILVGDSLGMVVMGHETTLSVTMDIMVHHTACVSRAVRHALVIADMPFLSYQTATRDAVLNAGRLVVEGGAHAVKLEGAGEEKLAAVRAIIAAGIPVMGHIGLEPQSIYRLGGYKVQGRDIEGSNQLREAAHALEDAGCFALVLECIPAELARTITESVDIPTIGIGAGAGCDGQVLVVHDALGLGKYTRFSKQYADLGASMKEAFDEYIREVKAGDFPGKEHEFQ